VLAEKPISPFLNANFMSKMKACTRLQYQMFLDKIRAIAPMLKKPHGANHFFLIMRSFSSALYFMQSLFQTFFYFKNGVKHETNTPKSTAKFWQKR